ncbi:MAG: calcium/sodium antiporter [Bacteroidaceae bacterium]|nr:calcium/sodium antiporter [Bacteroidaceae bacterium]
MSGAIVFLIIGLVLVVTGADVLIDGASAFARKWGVSEFVIGLTIVALGTSAPEMVVSFISAIQGNSDMAVGNIIGSNIFNTALILGISAVICPITITHENTHRDIPLNIAVTSVLILLGLRQSIFHLGMNGMNRTDGILFLAVFVWYMITSFRNGKQTDTDSSDSHDSFVKASIYIIGGLAALVFGGRMFVNNAETIARMAGWSDKFIAITILAAGTSLPELATSVVAAIKGRSQLALGNIIGSNTSNILLILGGASLIHPLDMNGIALTDYAAIFICALFLLISTFTCTRNRFDRVEGVILLIIEITYMGWLIHTV